MKLGTYITDENRIFVVQQMYNKGYIGYMFNPNGDNSPTFWDKNGKNFDPHTPNIVDAHLVESGMDAFVKEVHERLDNIDATLKEFRGRHGCL